MCNITNQMIQECIYSAVTNHFLRHVKVEVIIIFFLFCACMNYVVLQCSSLGRLAQTTGYDVITIYIYTCIYISSLY